MGNELSRRDICVRRIPQISLPTPQGTVAVLEKTERWSLGFLDVELHICVCSDATQFKLAKSSLKHSRYTCTMQLLLAFKKHNCVSHFMLF